MYKTELLTKEHKTNEQFSHFAAVRTLAKHHVKTLST